jgi:predicted AAA+ superfamily ATPase
MGQMPLNPHRTTTRQVTPPAISDRFGLNDVSLTLTAEEWMTVIAWVDQRPLSKKEEEIYKRALLKLQQQMLRAANDFRRRPR